MPETKPRQLNLPIDTSVLQRRLKVDTATKRLQKRKSRLCKDGGRTKRREQAAGVHTERPEHAENADDLLVKMMIGGSARNNRKPRRRLLKLDVGNAYCKAPKLRPISYMARPKSLARTDEHGVPMCVELHTPVYGEEVAGDEWDADFCKTCVDIGWHKAECVRALHYACLPGGEQANLLRIVDDILISVPADAGSIAEATIAAMEKRYGDITYEWEPTSFAGYTLVYGDSGTITLHMAQQIEHAVRQHLPGLLDSSYVPSQHIPKGQSLQSLADAMRLQPRAARLTPTQQRVAKVAGSLRFPEKCTLAITLLLHRISCVQSSPPPEAQLVCDLALELAYVHRYDGLTFGGALSSDRLDCGMHAHVVLEGRPAAELEGYADATWMAQLNAEYEQLPPLPQLAEIDPDSGLELPARDLYSLITMYRGAAIFHQTKKLGVLLDQSMAHEGIATAKLADVMITAREYARALGDPQDMPTLLCSDNMPNVQVATRHGAANRSKHMLRRYFVLMQRIQQKHIRLAFLPDPENPSDFLTKWLPQAKFNSSLCFAIGAVARPSKLPPIGGIPRRTKPKSQASGTLPAPP